MGAKAYRITAGKIGISNKQDSVIRNYGSSNRYVAGIIVLIRQMNQYDKP